MKVTLRRLEARDLYKLTSIVTPSIAESANLPYPFTRTNAESFIKNYNTWGIWVNHGSLIGAVEVKADLETAYFIAERWQGQGLATRAVIECRQKFGNSQLWCVVDPKNKASMRVAQKAGLRIKFVSL